MLKTFNVAYLYGHHPTEHLYPDDNSKTSFFEKGDTDTGDQNNSSRLMAAEGAEMDRYKRSK